jgi:hypothetical protein
LFIVRSREGFEHGKGRKTRWFSVRGEQRSAENRGFLEKPIGFCSILPGPPHKPAQESWF